MLRKVIALLVTRSLRFRITMWRSASPMPTAPKTNLFSLIYLMKYSSLYKHISTVVPSTHLMVLTANAAELHMVHESTNNTGLLAVIGIIFQVGAPEEQPFFRTLLDEWISIDQDRKDHCTEQQRNLDNNSNLRHRQLLEASDTPLYIYDIIPANGSFYRYEGGLTTPPCTEIVHWSVASRPLAISITEERDLAELILGYVSDDCAAGTVASTGGGTNRPTQPLNGRTVELLCPASFQPTTNGADSGAFSNYMTLTMVLLVLSLWLHY